MQARMKNLVMSANDAATAMPQMPRVAASDGSSASTRSRLDWMRIIAYWAFTLVIAWEMVAGSMWDLLQIEFTRTVFDHLGYPHYLLLIIGAWKLPCALALLAPRFERLKEWAYAGAFFNYTGAAASHFLVGDRAGKWLGPVIFGAMTLASWALRPPDRRLPHGTAASSTRLLSWIVPIGLTVAFLVLALLTLPKGAPSP